MSHVFISYSTRDHVYANRLAEKLRSEGFNVWIDNGELRSSEDLWRSIVLAMPTRSTANRVRWTYSCVEERIEERQDISMIYYQQGRHSGQH